MKRDMQAVETIREKFEAIRGALDERARRLWAAAEARSLLARRMELLAAAHRKIKHQMHEHTSAIST